jgi:hypothetical protein
MHDLLEGIVPHELKLLFKHLCDTGLLKLDDLNTRISGFSYDVADIKSKPSCIVFTREECNQNAAQTWTLARLLPFMIGDLIPEDDPGWKLYILLRKIMDIVFAPKSQKVYSFYLNSM